MSTTTTTETRNHRHRCPECKPLHYYDCGLSICRVPFEYPCPDYLRTPQPALDAEGEWRYEAIPIHGWRVLDVNGRTVAANIYREEDAAQIVSDHNSVITLLAALHDARHRIALLETEKEGSE
jgi:hypothetical protein